LCDTNKYSRFVQFGADQDCYCGAVCCRKKLGAKPCKTKNTTLEEAVKPVACKVTWKTPKVNLSFALLFFSHPVIAKQ